jgi:hypothetical protein
VIPIGVLASSRAAPAIPTATAIEDQYNRANSTSALGATPVGGKTWIQRSGTWGINANQLYVSNGVAGNVNLTLIDSEISDGVVRVVLAVAGMCGLLIRDDGSNNNLIVEVQTGASYAPKIYRGTAGSYVQIAAGAAVNLAVGTILTVKLVGNDIFVYGNGALIVSVTDSTRSTNTRQGAYIVGGAGASPATRLDSFSVRSLASPGAYSTEVLADSPLAYVRFSETSGGTAADSASPGSGRDFVLAGTYTRNATSLVDGTADPSLEVAGLGSGRMAYGSWMNPVGGYTLECVLRTTSADTRGVLDRDGSAGRRWQFYVGGGRIVWLDTSNLSDIQGVSGALVNNNLPHHVVLTHGGGSVRMYVDGLETASMTRADHTASTCPIGLAAQWGGGNSNNQPGSNRFVGGLDDFAYYAGVLSPDRVYAHAAAALAWL